MAAPRPGRIASSRRIRRVRRRLLGRPVGAGGEPLPGLHRRGGEGVHDVVTVRGQGGIQQGGDRDEDRALLGLHVLPALQQQVVHVGALRDHLRLHAQVQGEEGGGGFVAPPPGALGRRGVLLIHQGAGG